MTLYTSGTFCSLNIWVWAWNVALENHNLTCRGMEPSEMYVISGVFQSVHMQLYGCCCVNTAAMNMSNENQELPNFAWSNFKIMGRSISEADEWSTNILCIIQRRWRRAIRIFFHMCHDFNKRINTEVKSGIYEIWWVQNRSNIWYRYLKLAKRKLLLCSERPVSFLEAMEASGYVVGFGIYQGLLMYFCVCIRSDWCTRHLFSKI